MEAITNGAEDFLIDGLSFKLPHLQAMSLIERVLHFGRLVQMPIHQ